MSQGQLLRVLNEASASEDWLVVASGTPHVDVHKLWDASAGARCLMEVGFSCMAGEIPPPWECGWHVRTPARCTC